MDLERFPPGVRFSPTDEELVSYFLKARASGKNPHPKLISEVDIYKHEPWDLPEKSASHRSDPVWYFFNVQDNRHSHSARVSRTTSRGYWKATGKDRRISSGSHTVGIKKTLIYYEGRAPNGKRTDWVMHEYKMDEEYEKKNEAVCSPAVCRIRKKGGPGPRNGEQFGPPIHNETNEGVENVDDAVDEQISSPPPQRQDVVIHTLQAALVNPDAENSQNLHTEAFGLDDFPCVESVPNEQGDDTLNQLFLQFESPDLEKDLEFFSSNRTQGDDTYSEGLNVPCSWASFFQFSADDEHSHEQLQHFAEAGPSTLTPDSARTLIEEGFVEMDDMKTPLEDNFLLDYPTDLGIEQRQPPAELLEDGSMLGFPGDLWSQGFATRRLRMKVNPTSSSSQTNSLSSDTTADIISKVPKSNCSSVQIEKAGSNGVEPDMSSILLGSDSAMISQTSLPNHHSSKECLFLETAGCLKKRTFEPATSDLVLYSESKSYCVVETGLVCELECKSNGVSHSGPDAALCGDALQGEGFDCESGSSSRMPKESSKTLQTLSIDGNEDVNKLANEVKLLYLGSCQAKFERNMSTRINSSVLAFGKSLSSAFPTIAYTGPHSSLKSLSNIFGRLLRVAAVLLFVILVGLHILKYLA